ncbi:MAG: hypothetical protein VW127_04390 [Flavobacteriaceae bacterium]
MKKGLLGLLVIALTVVGCQNYDDQFDELNKKISDLASDVSDLEGVQTTINALSDKLDNLSDSALTDSDLTEILDEIGEIQNAVSALEGIEDEVADLENEVDEILERLGELLSANAVIQGDVIITNTGDLAVVQDLIGTEDDDPLVTIQGNVHVLINATNGLADSLAAVNAITNKLKIVQGTVTITTSAAVEMNELMYISANHTASGAGSVASPKLRTITGDLHVDLPGVLDYSVLTTVGSVLVSQTATVTQAHFNKVEFTTDGTNIDLPNATHVKIGGVLPASVTLDSAVHFESSGVGAQTATHIVIGGDDAVFSLAATSFTGAVTITTTAAADLSAITSAAALNVVATDINLSGITDFTGATTLSATTVNIGSMESSTDTVTLVGPTAVALPALTSLGGDFVAASAGSFSAPELATSTGTIDIKADGTVAIKSLTATSTIIDIATITGLTLGEQAATIDVSDFVHLTTLNYTGAHPASITPGSHVATNNLTVTSANASLTTLIIGDGGIGTLTVSDSTLDSLTTDGHIINTIVTNNSDMAEFTFGHRHADGDDATTVSIVGNTSSDFTAVDLSSLSKVKHVNITGNTSLTTITAPNAAVLAEPLATVTVTISGNDTTGTWEDATAATETTPYSAATASAAVVTSFKPFIEAYLDQTRTASVTFSIDVDNVGTGTMQAAMAADGDAQAGPDGTAGNDDDQTNGTGGVDTEAELALF